MGTDFAVESERWRWNECCDFRFEVMSCDYCGRFKSLPPPLGATAEQPPFFDGTTRLYTSYSCPFAQRVWITRNYKDPEKKKFLEEDLLQADIAYIPFVERFLIFLSEVFKYDITAGLPKLAAWIEELNKIDAYKQTKITDSKHLVEFYKQRFLAQN
ncbi:Glutathione S-transferase L3 [Hibiscus syriacus]|uniref:Glutathione S-transferase L3 n=1 Tax=Hibiscus syriacus TaxID=106335 RepID=A0A6A3BJG4_HIBSY|nr:Glutathione S-transferase L3 [Hibiscus syriacus]